jgi:hypothetical protein
VDEVVGAGEEAEREVHLVTRVPKAVQGLMEVLAGLLEGRVLGRDRGSPLSGEKVGAAEGQVVQGDIERPVLCAHPLQRLRGAGQDLELLPLVEEQVAVYETPGRVQQGKVGLPLPLRTLRLVEYRRGLGQASKRM